MSEILAGTSEHSSMAPLSQAQTVQMCQHLQGEIRSVESLLTDVQRELKHTQEHLQNLRNDFIQAHDDVHNLQVGAANTNTNVDRLSKELARVSVVAHQLQMTDQDTKDKINLLEETDRMLDTRMEFIVKDISVAKENNKRLTDTVNREVSEDLRVLRKEIANTNLALNQLCQEHEATALVAKGNIEAVRTANLDIEQVAVDVKKTNTVVNIMENRLATTAKGLSQCWSKCSELSDALVKVTECYDKTKARVIDNEGSIKDLNLSGKSTKEELDQVVRLVKVNTQRITHAEKLLAEESSTTEDMKQQINGLQQSGVNAMDRVTALHREFADLKSTTSAVKAGLKEQSSILLPNIHLDSAEAVGASKRHGSLLITSSMGRSPRA